MGCFEPFKDFKKELWNEKICCVSPKTNIILFKKLTFWTLQCMENATIIDRDLARCSITSFLDYVVTEEKSRIEPTKI